MDVAEFRALADRAVFVTGAGGFIGRRVADALVASGARVSALARSRGSAARLQARGIAPVMGGLDAGLDLAGQEIVFNFAHDFRAPAAVSLAGFQALLDAAARDGVARIVHASSAVVHDSWPGGDILDGGPMTTGGSPYRQVKIEMARSLAAQSIPAAILEPTIVYGPGGWMWTDGPVEKLLAGPVILPDPVGVCHAVHVDDVVRAALAAAGVEALGCERCVVSSGEPVTWEAFFEGYRAILGRGRIERRARDEIEARLPPPPAMAAPTAAQPGLTARLGGMARQALGPQAAERARLLAQRLKRLKGPVPQWPDRAAHALYCASGRCPAERMRTRLGVGQTTRLAAGQADCAPYISAKYG